MSGTARAPALLAVVALAGAACGGSGTNGAAARVTPATSGGSADRCPASAPLPSPASDHGAGAATGSTVAIEANDFFFAPTCVTGVPTGTFTLTVHNATQTLHNVTVQSLGIDKDVPAGQTVTLTIQVGSSPLPFFCKYHRASGMVGALLPSGG